MDILLTLISGSKVRILAHPPTNQILRRVLRNDASQKARLGSVWEARNWRQPAKRAGTRARNRRCPPYTSIQRTAARCQRAGPVGREHPLDSRTIPLSRRQRSGERDRFGHPVFVEFRKLRSRRSIIGVEPYPVRQALYVLQREAICEQCSAVL
jgi:hypothetical protein